MSPLLSIKLNSYLLGMLSLVYYLLYYFGARKPQIPNQNQQHHGKKQKNSSSSEQEQSPLDPLAAQIQFTKRPILFLSRLGQVLLFNTWFRVLCGILLLAGCDVLAWMMTISCLVVTGFVLYGVSMLKKRQECSIVNGKDRQALDWLNQTLGSDISLMDDALRQVLENCKSEKKSLIIVGVGSFNVLKRLEESKHLEQLESVKVLEPNEELIRKCKESTISNKIEFLRCEYLEISKYSADIVMLQMKYLKHLDNKSTSELIQNCRNIAKVGLIIGDLQRSNFIDMFTLINVGSCISTHDLLTLNEWNSFLNRQVKIETNQISGIWTFGRTSSCTAVTLFASSGTTTTPSTDGSGSSANNNGFLSL